MTPFIVTDVDSGKRIALNPAKVVSIEPSDESSAYPQTFITYSDPNLTLNVEGSWAEIVGLFEDALTETRRANNDHLARLGL